MTSSGPVHRYRHCSECGHALNVTMLLPGRRYRCEDCGATFRHFPELSIPSPVEDKPRPNAMLRVALSGVFCALAVFAMSVVGEFEIDSGTLALICSASAFMTMLLTVLARRLARDSSAFTATLMICIGLGTLVAYIFSGDVAEERQRGMIFAMMACLALGGIAFSKFIRNLSYPDVGRDGIIKPQA